MTIYVDDWRQPATFGGTWSRLAVGPEDSLEELHEFARQAGLQRAWFQDKPWPHQHYGVTDELRRKVIGLGAKPVTWRELGEMHVAARKGRLWRERNAALAAEAARIAPHLREHFPRNDAMTQALKAAEEAGEAGEALLAGADAAVIGAELADVVITVHLWAYWIGASIGSEPCPAGLPWLSAEPERLALELSIACAGAIGTYCRYNGLSRRPGTLADVTRAMAETIRCAYDLASRLDIDLDDAWRAKAAIIHARGWRERSAPPAEAS
jgi:NTP pyrophosphatase (non-canonical NTP hydrolase)